LQVDFENLFSVHKPEGYVLVLALIDERN